MTEQSKRRLALINAKDPLSKTERAIQNIMNSGVDDGDGWKQHRASIAKWHETQVHAAILGVLSEIEWAWCHELPKNMIARPDNAVIKKIAEIRQRIGGEK